MHIADRIDHGVEQFVAVVWREVGQLGIFRVAPQGFHRVQIGRVARQPLDVQPVHALLSQLSDRAAMSRQAVHDHNQRATELTMQLFQVTHDFRRPHVVRVNREALAQLPTR